MQDRLQQFIPFIPPAFPATMQRIDCLADHKRTKLQVGCFRNDKPHLVVAFSGQHYTSQPCIVNGGVIGPLSLALPRAAAHRS